MVSDVNLHPYTPGRAAAVDADSDGTVGPWERLKSVRKLKDNTEFFMFAENLAWSSVGMCNRRL